jgi:hypothetical protein
MRMRLRARASFLNYFHYGNLLSLNELVHAKTRIAPARKLLDLLELKNPMASALDNVSVRHEPTSR